jgi:hypothetical protein
VADPGFQVRGGALKKIAPSGGRREKFGGISCEKSRFYAKKSYFFQLRREARTFLGYFVWKITILCKKNHIFSNFMGGGAGATGAQPPPPGSAPVLCGNQNKMDDTKTHTGTLNELFFITNVHFCISSILKFYSHSDRLTSNYLNKCMQWIRKYIRKYGYYRWLSFFNSCSNAKWK